MRLKRTTPSVGNCKHRCQGDALRKIDRCDHCAGYDATAHAANLVGISLVSGEITSKVPLGFAEDGLVGVGQNIAWEPDSGAVAVSGENAAGDHLFGVVDPSTGKLTQRAQLNCTEPKCLPVRAWVRCFISVPHFIDAWTLRRSCRAQQTTPRTRRSI